MSTAVTSARNVRVKPDAKNAETTLTCTMVSIAQQKQEPATTALMDASPVFPLDSVPLARAVMP